MDSEVNSVVTKVEESREGKTLLTSLPFVPSIGLFGAIIESPPLESEDLFSVVVV